MKVTDNEKVLDFSAVLTAHGIGEIAKEYAEGPTTPEVENELYTICDELAEKWAENDEEKVEAYNWCIELIQNLVEKGNVFFKRWEK